MERNKTRTAIKISKLTKNYKIYNNLSDQAMDVLGLSWLRIWKKPQYRIFTALDTLDLEIKKGERLGIIGRNGAGKTTLLKLIAGNFQPSSGEIQIDGNVQALMQTGLGFHNELSGIENIKSALLYNGLTGYDLNEAVDDIIDFCELGDFINQPVKTYSLGMMGRLQFATATAIKPDIVIVDEVLGAGDAYFSGKSNERMRQLTSDGTTLLIVSHSMSQILQFSDRVVWIDNGRIELDGKPLPTVNAYEEFIHKLDADLIKKSRITAEKSQMENLPQFLIEKQKMGLKKGADWGGAGPLRITDLKCINKNGRQISKIHTGESFGFKATIMSNKPGKYLCSCLFVLYDEMGQVVTKIIEPEREYDFRKKSHHVEVWFDTNPIGSGKYFLSGGLYKDFDNLTPETAHRYHILSRGSVLSVFSKTKDDSKVIMMAKWKSN